jgi:cytochrome c oxidase subunit 4
MSQHVAPAKNYIYVFLALMFFTALTVAAAFVNFAHHAPKGIGNVLNDAVAMSIALTKAVLVVTFFMHVKGSTRITPVVIWGTLAFVAILFAFPIADYMTRPATEFIPVFSR